MKKLTLVILSSTFIVTTHAQTVSEKLDAYMVALNKYANFNGSVLVAKDGNIILEKGYGLRNVEGKVAHDANSIFQIGSVTKQFTSTLILMLQQQGKLSVKDNLSKYFPEYKYADKITIENLLNHVSGIYNYTNDADYMQNHITETLSQQAFWNRIKDKPLDFEPGTKFSYSNSGYVVLGYVIEKVTGKPYTALVREYLFQPANMVHSGFDFTHLQSPLKSIGYLELKNDVHQTAPIVDSTASFSAGSVYSTVHDLYNWNTNLNAGKIIPLPVLETAYNPYKEHYGYGFMIDSMMGKRHISHGGGIHGFVSFLSYTPEDKVSVVLISNASYNLAPVEKDLLAVLYNQPYKLAEPLTEIKVDTNILKQYVGEYEIAPTFKITISYENGGLKARPTGQGLFDLFAKSENIFFLKVVDAQVEFIKNEKGEVEKLILHQNGQNLPGKKVK